MRRAAFLLCWVAGCVGCQTQPAADDEASSSEAGPPTIAGAPAPVAPSPAPGGDPFSGIEALRPRPWTAWPLENVDIDLEAGWRIDPVSGKFELEDALTLSADPGAFVLAIAPGEVVELRALADAGDGLELIIGHGDGIESRYAPVTDPLVHAGMPVTRGSAIALASGKQLELRVTVDGVAIDPLLVLRAPLHRWPGLLRSLPPELRPGAQSPGQSSSG